MYAGHREYSVHRLTAALVVDTDALAADDALQNPQDRLPGIRRPAAIDDRECLNVRGNEDLRGLKHLEVDPRPTGTCQRQQCDSTQTS